MTIDDEKLKMWLEAAIESAFRAGAEEERAAAVAWLREQRDNTFLPPIPFGEMLRAADMIERGAHRREEER